jgi:hypothetical protein
MQINDGLIKSSLRCSCPKSGDFQEHIFFNSKILPEKTVYLDGLPLLKTNKDNNLKSLAC